MNNLLQRFSNQNKLDEQSNQFYLSEYILQLQYKQTFSQTKIQLSIMLNHKLRKFFSTPLLSVMKCQTADTVLAPIQIECFIRMNYQYLFSTKKKKLFNLAHQANKCANAKMCKKEVGHRLNKTTTMCYAKKIIWHFKGVSLPQSSRRNKLDFAA